MMVGLVGLFMVAAAFKPSWRLPVLIYSALEKTFLITLVLSNVNRSFSEGFWGPATMDAIIVLYSLLYFWTRREE